MKRLFYDIETSPNVVLSWRVGYKIAIDYENIVKERAIICIGYKWEGELPHVLTWDDKHSDKSMLLKFSAIASGADEFVGHNIDRFDLPWVKTRCLFHGIDPLPVMHTADTLQWARRRFMFNSNRLDYLASYLGLGKKIKTEFKLWKEVLLENNMTALAKMKRYCTHDVAILEKVWRRLSIYCPAKTHAGVMAGKDKSTCPRCGSARFYQWSRWATAAGSIRQRMRCKDCKGTYTLPESALAA